MSLGYILFQTRKFMEGYESILQESTEFRLKDTFDQITGDLQVIYDAVFGDRYYFDDMESYWMEDSVEYLNNLLNQYLTELKKHKDSKKICLKQCSLPQLLLVIKGTKKLQKIKDRLKRVRSMVDKYPISQTDHSERNLKWTTGDVDDSNIVGWNDQAEKIIEGSLIKENEDGLNVVGIVGMYGAGKTSLAQKIFVNDQVIDHFQLRLWVSVSEGCTKEQLLRRTLYNLGIVDDHIDQMLRTKPELEPVGVLLFLVHMELSNMRYLIVFDDVVNPEDHWYWELDMNPPYKDGEELQWNDRLAYGLPNGGGSAVIVTSRKEFEILKMVGGGDIHTPEPLLEEDGWTLFKSSFEHAAGRRFNNPNLEGLRKQIVNKCEGFPLALKAAGEGIAQDEGGLVQEAPTVAGSEMNQDEKQGNKESIQDEPSSQ